MQHHLPCVSIIHQSCLSSVGKRTRSPAMSEPGSSDPQLTKSITLKSPFQKKTDVFDSEDFDPVKFVNQIYPDGMYGGCSSAQHFKDHAV